MYDTICPDCKREEACGLPYESKASNSEQCQILFEEIAEGLYYCDLCKLIIPVPCDAFEKYFQNADNQWRIFLEKHEEYLRQLRQRFYMGEALTDSEMQTLSTVDAFFKARENIREDYLCSPSANFRKRAYQFVKAFESLNALEK